MKTFRVSLWYEEMGSTVVEANSKEEAEEKVRTILSTDGVDKLEDFDLSDRDYGIADCEEIK